MEKPCFFVPQTCYVSPNVDSLYRCFPSDLATTLLIYSHPPILSCQFTFYTDSTSFIPSCTLQGHCEFPTGIHPFERCSTISGVVLDLLEQFRVPLNRLSNQTTQLCTYTITLLHPTKEDVLKSWDTTTHDQRQR